MPDLVPDSFPRWYTWAAHGVHAYTASGVVFALLAAVEVCAPVPDSRWVFLWLIIAVVIDASDGTLARRYHVKTTAPLIDGRKIDDIVDYLTFTFVPLLLVWRMAWAPAPAALWVGLAMITSLFGFANERAKQEGEGFFLGFPSYWNIFAFYAGIWDGMGARMVSGVLIVVLAMMTVLPVRFIYPNLAPRFLRLPMIVGGLIWLLILIVMLPDYPNVSAWLMWVSLVYPAFYIVTSVGLDVISRRRHRVSVGTSTVTVDADQLAE